MMRAIFYIDGADDLIGEHGEGMLITELDSLMLARAEGRVVLMATLPGADQSDVVKVHPSWSHSDLKVFLLAESKEDMIDMRPLAYQMKKGN